jgi:uncharacterized glyoxalase superfamily protein PhnB
MPSANASKPEPMIIISLRYADAPRMYDWLIEAFGFEKHAAYYSEDGRTLLHGELRMGASFVMLGSSEGNEFGKLVSRPAELGGTTASPYIATDDIDARCERARKAGAQICMEPTDQPYGTATSSARTPRATSGASAPIALLSPRPEVAASIGAPAASASRRC